MINTILLRLKGILTKRILIPLFLITILSSYTYPEEPVSLVNPFIGSTTEGSLGKTFPGATAPFGMVQISPNTITGGDNGSGYSYQHRTIEGFAFTQMSGVGWFGDLGNLLVMPTTGPLYTNSGKEGGVRGYRSFYDKNSEEASAGYYKVFLTDYGIKTEMTAAVHSGILRFTFPESDRSRIQIDLARRVGGTSTLQSIRVIDDQTISGRMVCTPEGGGWGNGSGKADYTVYFYASFSKPMKKYGVWTADIPENQDRRRRFIESMDFQRITAGATVKEGVSCFEGKHIGFYTEFSTAKDEEVLFKAGISFTSEEAARKNLETEIKDWDFDGRVRKTQELWNNALSKISITGGTDEQRTVFYTALYHTMIDPRTFTDTDGSYMGGDGKIHKTEKFTKRTIFSGWDVFRSQIPLQTIINPSVVNDMIHSLTELAEENGSGYYERWEFLNAYSGCMVGNPAISMLADAYFKGITDVDIQKAYQMGANTVRKFGNREETGYASDGKRRDQVSLTLEYAYSEWCMARLAEALGKRKDKIHYDHMAGSYRNLYDTDKHSFRPRSEDGSFLPWPTKGKLQHWYGCVESNELQQGWFVPHDISGMVELMGGRERVIADLDTMFEKTPKDFRWNNYYNHSNEPVHHVPFLYNRLGQPWKTQKWVRTICEKAYQNDVKGLIGNDDVGQMSAWYVLAACGIHPICPGETIFELCSPLFDEICFHLDNGRSFTIKTYNNSAENIYIQSIRLNGKKYTSTSIDYMEIMKGGVLEMEMGPEPAGLC